MKHVFSAIGCVVAVLMLTSRSFARHAHLTHGKEAAAAVAIIVVFHLIGVVVGRALKPKPAATPARSSYTFGSGTRR